MSNFALAKALLVLNQFGTLHPEWSVSDLSQTTGLSKSNVSRILKEFRAQGFLIQDKFLCATALGRRLSRSGPGTSRAPAW
jgi:DNA-binding IclR family transcriptional regulator